MTESSTDIALRGRTGITHRARGEFDHGQMELIRATVAKDCNPAELAMFLELCARYELDPFSKQVWAMKIRGGVQVVVSRDGLLSLANRHTPSQGFSGPGEFMGCKSDVVREGDEFRVLHTSKDTEVRHGYGLERGQIKGAWAVVHRRDHAPTYFFAEWATYNTGQNVWKSHPEAMIVKSAEAMALRKAFSISGVIGEAEVGRQQVLTSVSEDPQGDVIDWPEDEQLRRELQAAFEALGYRRAKIRLLLAGKTEDEHRALLADLHAEADGAGLDPSEAVEGPETASQAPQQADDEEPVADAEVIG